MNIFILLFRAKRKNRGGKANKRRREDKSGSPGKDRGHI